MIKVKDWSISISERNSAIYTIENGLEHLVRQNGRDLAEIKQSGDNIIITINGVQIVLNDVNKSMSISQAVKIG